MRPVPAPAGSAIRPRLSARVRHACFAVLLTALALSASASAARADIPPEGMRSEGRHASRTYRRVGFGGSLAVVLMVVIARRRRAASRAAAPPREPGDTDKS